MKFYDWLITYADCLDPIGDLARDALRDPHAPRRGTVNEWCFYVAHSPGACRQAGEVLEEAIQEFRKAARTQPDQPVDNFFWE